MAYGRLDVFAPDGPIQTFPLTEKTVSVGRSAGNTIALDNNTISRYHFTLIHEDGQVYVTDLDSANGTYLDGVKLPTNERRLLLDGDEILIGNLRMIYHVVDDTPTVKLSPLNDTTQRVEMALSNFYIDLQGPGQSVAPGAHISAELSITNTTAAEERYKVEVSGPPEDWIRIDRPTPLIGAGETSFVLINFKPLRHSTSTPGNYEVRVRVYPKTQPKDVLEARLTLTVLPYGSFSIRMENQELTVGERFQLALQNDGSANLPLSLRGQYRSSELDVRFASSRFVLAPGQRRVVEGEARPQKSIWIGSPKRYSFDVLAQSHDHAAFLIPIRAYLTVKPLLPAWMLTIMAGGLAMIALVAVVAALLLLNQPPPQPVISDFTLSSRELPRGEVLEVGWQATDADTMRLLLNGTPVAEEPDPQRVSINVDTAGLSGEVDVELQAINGDQFDSRSATVLVYEPMTVERFEVTPPQLVRYVVQGLNIDWNVPGAISTRLTGLEGFSTLAIEADGPTATFTDIPGIPTDPMVLRLIAHDAFGNTLESRLTVNVVNPECVPANNQVRIFVGPDPRHQVVGTVPPTGVVTVDARDKSGGWLRVVGLTGGLSGWAPAAALNCSASFDVSDLRVEPNVPTPPPTLTATLSPTPTLTPTIGPTATIIPSLVPQFTPSG
jgi:hypothetical protein